MSGHSSGICEEKRPVTDALAACCLTLADFPKRIQLAANEEISAFFLLPVLGPVAPRSADETAAALCRRQQQCPAPTTNAADEFVTAFAGGLGNTMC